jgi:hypothetical protein
MTDLYDKEAMGEGLIDSKALLNSSTINEDIVEDFTQGSVLKKASIRNSGLRWFTLALS